MIRDENDTLLPPHASMPVMIHISIHASEQLLNQTFEALSISADDLPHVREAVMTLLEAGYDLNFNFSRQNDQSKPPFDLPDALTRHSEYLRRLPAEMQVSKDDIQIGFREAEQKPSWAERVEPKPVEQEHDDHWSPPPFMRER